MATRYEADIVSWANEQAEFIRNKQFHLLDLAHLAEEIEDVGKSEKRELASRMAVLMAHLLKWHYQPERRSNSWSRTIKTQRIQIALALQETPSLRTSFTDESWQKRAWADAMDLATRETGLDTFPEVCPWSIADVLTEGWLPA